MALRIAKSLGVEILKSVLDSNKNNNKTNISTRQQSVKTLIRQIICLVQSGLKMFAYPRAS